ncbi:MAG: hypothetical protein LUE86_02205 [Clostridiales bacterium]|nr:hypothetical protein [Clostridiales bacterium]
MRKKLLILVPVMAGLIVGCGNNDAAEWRAANQAETTVIAETTAETDTESASENIVIRQDEKTDDTDIGWPVYYDEIDPTLSGEEFLETETVRHGAGGGNADMETTAKPERITEAESSTEESVESTVTESTKTETTSAETSTAASVTSESPEHEGTADEVVSIEETKSTEAETEEESTSATSRTLPGSAVSYAKGSAELSGPVLLEPSVEIPDGYDGVRWYSDELHTIQIRFPFVITSEARQNGIDLYPVYYAY